MDNDLDEVMLRQIKSCPLLTPEGVAQLFERYRAGDLGAKNLLIQSNLRLVLSIANSHRGHLPLGDAFQEGVLGLIKAVEKFDLDKKTEFSTYATHWIKQKIGRARRKDATIKLPEDVHIELWAYWRHRDGGTDELLSSQARARLARIEAISRRPIPLDVPSEPGGLDCLGDIIPDENALDQFLQVFTCVVLDDDVRQAVDELSNSLRLVLVAHYLEGLTADQIANDCGKAVVTIRTQLSKALRLLRQRLVSTGVP